MMTEDFMLSVIRTHNAINNFNNLIESNKIYELDEEKLTNQFLIMSTLNNNENHLTKQETEVLKKANTFATNLNKKCKEEILTKEEQKVLKTLLTSTILYSNKEINKDTLTTVINRYINSQKTFSSHDLLLYTQYIFNFLNENQNSNTKLEYTYMEAKMTAQKKSSNENIIKINREFFEYSENLNEKEFHELLMYMTFGLLHELSHIKQYEYLKNVNNIEQDELFNDILISTNTKEYEKYHDSLLAERIANEYAINNLPYVLKDIIPKEEMIAYQNKVKQEIKTTPEEKYIKNQEQLIQNAKELLTSEDINTISEVFKTK